MFYVNQPRTVYRFATKSFLEAIDSTVFYSSKSEQDFTLNPVQSEPGKKSGNRKERRTEKAANRSRAKRRNRNGSKP